MNWLLWREYRLNRLILAAGAVLLLLPYVVALVAVGALVVMEEPIEGILEGALAWSLLSSWIAVLLMASNAIAGERTDRSAEFLAYLPLPRKQLLAAKLLLSLIAVATMLGFHTLASIICFGPAETVRNVDPRLLTTLISILLLTYGASWLMSSLQSSVVVAAVSGFVTTVLVLFCVAYFVGARIEETTEPVDVDEYVLKPMIMWMIASSLSVAVVCFAIGTWKYLRTTELR
ncbi:MAG: hypothetical protein ACR2NM_04205 [Bythopirellula sp.]